MMNETEKKFSQFVSPRKNKQKTTYQKPQYDTHSEKTKQNNHHDGHRSRTKKLNQKKNTPN
mgnify:CR=1 FL=1